MSSGESREQLEARVLRGTRALGREASLFSQAVADRLGLALTDVEVLDLLADTGPVTAGRLSELSGLTSGATTRLIDRLEQAGYVRRVADPADRRRVMVEADPARMQTIGQLHTSMKEAERAAFATYTENDLRLLVDFLARGARLVNEEARKMREPEDTEAAEGSGSFAAPLAGITNARLVFLSGAPNVNLRGDTTIRELYRARFAGAVPRVRVRGNAVTVTYPKFGWFDWRAVIAGQNVEASVHWRKDRGDLALNAGVRWAIELRGGVSKFAGDLRSIDVASFDLRGGGGKIDLDLPRPSGVVPIRIHGGMSYLGIHRPAGTAIGLSLHGGASYVALDGEQIKGTGPLSMQSPGADAARDRYEVEVHGGGNKIVIGAR